MSPVSFKMQHPSGSFPMANENYEYLTYLEVFHLKATNLSKPCLLHQIQFPSCYFASKDEIMVLFGGSQIG